MFDSTIFTQEMLSNPSRLAKAMIDAMETSDTTGAIQINDPNNGFVMQLFANVSIFSKFSEKIDYVNNFFYSQRARTAEQLFPHLSEFDYVNLMAAPATLPFVFAMSRQWIVDNAVFFDANYNKIQIPTTTSITMGGIVYSVYYPIDILVNRNTGAITAFYNTDTTNTLFSLDTNMLLDTREYFQNGLNYFQIMFNMFQFDRKVSTYTVSSQQGFIKTLPFDDQFYAAKVFSYQSDGTWAELAYSLVEMYYDFTVPTALLTILSDTSQLKVTIPQIYFDNNQISQTIKIELYTTKGKVNYALSAADVTGLKANFDPTSSSFTKPLAQMPTWTILPTSIEVEGGGDAMAFDQIRTAIVNQQLHDRVAITTQELIEAGNKVGFKLTREIDDLTERMYSAANVLTDTNNMVIPTFTGSVLIADDALNGNPDTIIKHTDGYYTILPTTTFKISNQSLTCTPLSNGEVAALQAMDKASMIAELNTGNYIRQPFHITLLTTVKSPAAQIYSLLSPEMTSLSFIKENAHSAPQMSAVACSVVHQNSGTGGYQIQLSVGRSSNIQQAASTNFQVLLTCKSKIGEDIYLPTAYAGTDNTGNDVWEAILSTNYHITTDEHITVMMYNVSNTLVSVEIPLAQTFSIITSFVSTFEPTVPADSTLNALLPAPYAITQIAMSQQQLNLTFGQNLSDQIYCGVNTTWGNDVYAVAEETVYYETAVPIFQTNETGIIETRINETSGHVEIVVLYDANSTPAETSDIETTTTTDTAVSNTPSFHVVDVTGLLVGMKVRGTNIPVGSLVAAIVGNVVTLSLPTTQIIPAGTSLTFTNQALLKRTIESQDEPGVTLTLADTSDLLIGMSAVGFGIPTGTKILTIPNATSVTLTVATTEVVDLGTLVTFINKMAHGVIKSQAGDVLTDATGAPIIVKDAQNQFRIPTILFDGRLFESNDPTDIQVVAEIAGKLQNYANQVSTIDSGLSESSDVYYKPARTMGFATFGIGDSNTIQLPLELSFTITVFVDIATFNTTTLIDTMTQTIYQIINEEIQNPTISSSEIAQTLVDKLGSNVTNVEVFGINGDDSLRLAALEEAGTTPSIEYKLFLQPDGTVKRLPNINITYLPRPETVDMVEANRI